MRERLRSLYSRRIGRSPRGAPALADGEFSRQPAQSTILGAGKLTGRVGSFAVGTLAAISQEEAAEIALGCPSVLTGSPSSFASWTAPR
jgi:hypothetical protein